MDAVLERIRKIERLVSEAEMIDGEERDQKAFLRAVQSQNKQLIADIQKLIKDGKSSGDQALDIQIMLEDTVIKGKTYQRLAWLQAALSRHPDDLITTRFISGHAEVGLLPTTPSITWWIDRGGIPDKYVKIAVQRGCTDITGRHLLPTLSDGPMKHMHHLFANQFDRNEPKGDYAKMDNHLEIVVGSKAIQRWMKTLSPSDALKVYIAARLIGRPLTMYPELALEIRDRRERFIVSLTEAMAELKRLEDELLSCKHDPAWALQREHPKHRVTIDDSPEGGVTIDFGLTDSIKKQKQVLWSMVNNATVGVEMGDNTTLKKAASVVGYMLQA